METKLLRGEQEKDLQEAARSIRQDVQQKVPAYSLKERESPRLHTFQGTVCGKEEALL